ncbi:hypothetical protein KAFR_0G02760 [Kazachstania africana CBS 2517]|uniref:RNA helicase n=1 Tax=Kazachstania africana (strain ATCC 22294 / BCRC 22015 / CBS 2517 / CECT 1963 / NBRC 1671 / NRRL Y-8276) TaxID=1071382 RepID=H2AY57_KAZAF|nr:hypothetical protein KAFR_0G02760 [Kazachstania africana CBS 2517]CCF59307.1 hypothetical protein KAFR_0G02760 [Kazachstania africana CBS 2517]
MNAEITKLIGTDDLTIIEFLKDIREKTRNLADFKGQVLSLEVGFDEDTINRLYDLLSGDHDSPFNILDFLKNVLQITNSEDVKIISDFIIDLLSTTTSWNDFRDKMVGIDSGIPEAALLELYSQMKGDIKTEETVAEVIVKMEENEAHGLSLPNENIEWSKLDDPSDVLPKLPMRQLDHSPQMNKVYKGRIKRVMTFGCFVEIFGTELKKCDGLMHISEMSKRRISDPYDIVVEDQDVYVKVIKLHPNGKISLSMKNVDQITGKDNNLEIMSEINGRQGRQKQANSKLIRNRRLTSPERWEIRQLISSGAASIEDYPELTEETEQKKDNVDNNETENLDVELNKDDAPRFLGGEMNELSDQYEAQKVSKVPKGSMNRSAMYGSNLLREHRENKMKKRKDIENEIRKKRNLEDPTVNKDKSREEIEFLKTQLVVTAWERKRMKEKVSFGKRTNLPMMEQRRSLPIYQMRSELVKAVKENQFLVIVGETGSGKTTQITQYLDEEGLSGKGIIGCTQPRRVAAVSVAKRVADEMGVKVGSDVGYTIRFEDQTSPKTRIKYMTDGMLQREALLDPMMSKYSVIMLDEAHERTIATDVLFALLKEAGKKRPDLKVIITSATLDSAKFSKYFLDCPIINIPGKTFPVEVMYSTTPTMDYIEAALDCVMNIHINNDPGDILVFLTGQEEIDSCCEILFERVKTLGDTIGNLLILPIYSALPSEIQSKIFEPTPKDTRKVVLATNIAETSVTIDGIYYVVDPGFSKVNSYNSRAGMEQLVVTSISQAQANQRKGRAGRTGPGKCYRLYTESAFYNEMSRNSVPEIQRQNLSHTILMLKAMGINDLINFEFMDPPPKSLMVSALNDLYNLEALDNDGYLTKLGQRMSQFPMDPTLAKTLVASVSNECSEEITIIVSMLSVQNVFYRPKGKQQEADLKKVNFHHPYGDHLTLLNVFKAWERNNYSERFCELNFLHYRHLKKANDVRKQISQLLQKFGLPVTSCHGDPDVIRKTLVSGFFMNASKRDSQVGYRTIRGNNVVGIHPSSSLHGKEFEYVIYHSLVLTAKEYMSQVTSIEPGWLIEMAPHFYKEIGSDSQSRKRLKIQPLYNKFSKDQNSWRLSSIRQTREKALGVKR